MSVVATATFFFLHLCFVLLFASLQDFQVGACSRRRSFGDFPTNISLLASGLVVPFSSCLPCPFAGLDTFVLQLQLARAHQYIRKYFPCGSHLRLRHSNNKQKPRIVVCFSRDTHCLFLLVLCAFQARWGGAVFIDYIMRHLIFAPKWPCWPCVTHAAPGRRSFGLCTGFGMVPHAPVAALGPAHALHNAPKALARFGRFILGMLAGTTGPGLHASGE